MIKRPPYIHAYLPHENLEFSNGCIEFSSLLRQLALLSPYSRVDTYSTTKEQMKTGIGLDPLNNMEEIIEFLMNHAKGEDRDFSVFRQIMAERRLDGWSVVDMLYHFSNAPSPNYIYCDPARTAAQTPNYNLSHWLRIVEAIINWKRPLYLWCGDKKFWTERKGLFDPERTIANWFCWVPQQVETSQIPSAAIVRPMLGGTLIVSLEQYFNIDHLESVQRVNDVEVEMNEAGILPHHTELNSK